jgi:hypothetical protein
VIRKQIANRIVGVIVVLTACVYAGDYAVLRVRMLHQTPTWPFEPMTRVRLLSIPMKNGTNTYEIDQVNPTEVVTCVHAIFPHSGDQPCWYLKPRLNRPIRIG